MHLNKVEKNFKLKQKKKAIIHQTGKRKESSVNLLIVDKTKIPKVEYVRPVNRISEVNPVYLIKNNANKKKKINPSYNYNINPINKKIFTLQNETKLKITKGRFIHHDTLPDKSKKYHIQNKKKHKDVIGIKQMKQKDEENLPPESIQKISYIGSKKSDINVKELKKENLNQQKKLQQKNRKDTICKGSVLITKDLILDQIEDGEELREAYTLINNTMIPINAVFQAVKGGYQKEIRKNQLTQEKSKTGKTIKSNTGIKANTTPKGYGNTKEKNHIVDFRESIKENKFKYQSDSKKVKEKSSFINSMKENQKKNQNYKKNQDYKKNRILAYVGSQFKSGESNDSLLRVGKDILKMKIMGGIMAITKYIAIGFLSLLVQIAVTALPVILIIAILYNSPLAIFLPSLDDKETVITVLTSYESEFYQKIEDEKNTEDCNTVQVIFAGLKGDGENQGNLADVMCIYMIKHGYGDTATVMNAQSKLSLFHIFQHMCNYTISFKTEIIQTTEIEIDEDGNEVEAIVEEYFTTKLITITLLSYEDIIAEGDFEQEDIELLHEMMKAEYLSQIPGMK